MLMMRKLLIGFVVLCVSCSSDPCDEPVPSKGDGTMVRVQTRVEGNALAAEVNAGLYMVNYLEGKQDELLAKANYVNNQLLTYSDNAWSTAKPIYWSDTTTPADFYAYAPYKNEVEDARALSFAISCDQTTKERVAQSDFMWGALLGQSPTESSFDLSLSHLFSQLTVKVTVANDLNVSTDDVEVMIGGTKTSAKIDLSTGEVTPDGEIEEVKCYDNGDLSYTAILIPQQVPFSNFIRIVWNGSPYVLQNAFKLESKRQYTITVKLKKTESGFDVGIDGWDIIDEDFGGTVGG